MSVENLLLSIYKEPEYDLNLLCDISVQLLKNEYIFDKKLEEIVECEQLEVDWDKQLDLTIESNNLDVNVNKQKRKKIELISDEPIKPKIIKRNHPVIRVDRPYIPDVEKCLDIDFLIKELYYIPSEYIQDNLSNISMAEFTRWKNIEQYLIIVDTQIKDLNDENKWKPWIRITSKLELRNGGAIKKVINISIWHLKKYNSDMGHIVDLLYDALKLHKPNAAGACRKVALSTLEIA